MASMDLWFGFEAAHVFPLEHESIWIQHGYGRWITDMDDSTGQSRINSIQNGLLMSAQIHSLFDQYAFSINPDVSHPSSLKVIRVASVLT
jgi:hypothetical protein